MPFLVLAVLFSIITLSAWSAGAGQDYSLSLRFSNATVALIAYLGKIIWPRDMHLFHSFSPQIPVWKVAGAMALILGASAAAIWTRKKMPYFFVGWFWYVITLLPVLGIMQSGVLWMHEHYTYLPSIGIGMMLAWGIPNLLPDIATRRKILFPAATAVLCFMAFLSWQQCAYWKSSVALFSQAVKISEDKVLAHNLLGMALMEEGKSDQALYHYNEAIRLKPDYAPSYYNRGTLYTKAGNYLSAIADLDKAIGLDPGYVTAYNNRGIAFAKMNQYPQALRDFDKAISLKKDYADAYDNRAYVYFNQGDRRSACRDITMACQSGKCDKLKNTIASGYCH